MFLSFWAIFCPFHPPLNNLENQNFEKMKKASGDVIILNMWTKNHNHMIYASWDMVRDRQNVFSFSTIICSFTPSLSLLTTQKIRILKKWKDEKNSWIYHYFTQAHYKQQWFLRLISDNDSTICMVPKIWKATDRIFCRFGLFFCPFTSLTTNKIKIF